MINVQGRAIVKIVLEVDVTQPWGQNTLIKDLYRTTEREAIELVQQKIATVGGIRIVGKAEVTAVLVPEPR